MESVIDQGPIVQSVVNLLSLLGQKKKIIRFSGPAMCTKKSEHKPFFSVSDKKNTSASRYSVLVRRGF